MKIQIYRKDKLISLPERKTVHSVGLDVYAAQSVELWPGRVAIVPTGLIIKSPPGYFFKIFIRSGFAIQNGISLVNDVGIVDEDYCGPEDEVKIALIRHYNPDDPLLKRPLIIEKGMRFAQIIFEKNVVTDIEWEEQMKSDFAGRSRGGLGSTGTH